jgi:hypothetical protein
MNDFLKTLRLGFYVCALPLVATAIVSAHSFVSPSSLDETNPLETIVASTSEIGQAVADVVPGVSHVLNVDANGGVSGRLLIQGEAGLHGASGLNITLNRLGKVSAEATTGPDGTFRIENAAAGAYTLIATSENCLATFGVYVVAGEGLVLPANEIQFNVVAASSNPVEVRSALNADVVASQYNYFPKATELPVTHASTVVSLKQDGTFDGRVVPLLWNSADKPFELTGNEVHLFNRDGKVASVSVDAEGYFNFGSVAPGSYDFVSNGPHGAAALAIDVRPAGDVTAQNASAGNQYTDGCCFETVLCEPVVVQESVIVEEVVGNPAPIADQGCVDQNCCGGGFAGGGACCGGGGGGGGGFGGLGGFSDLIGAALGIWLISEAINDDGVIRQPTIVPPVVIPPVIS